MSHLRSVPADPGGYVPGEISRQVERQRESNWVGLDPAKRMFAIEYVRCLSHVEAARKIGKSGQGASMLRDPLVLALISDLQEDYHQTNVVTEQFIRHKLLELLPKVMGEEEVAIVLSNGEEIKAKKFDATATRGVLAELGVSIKREEGVKIHHTGEIEHTHGVSVKDVEGLYALIADNEPQLIEGEVIDDDHVSTDSESE